MWFISSNFSPMLHRYTCQTLTPPPLRRVIAPCQGLTWVRTATGLALSWHKPCTGVDRCFSFLLLHLSADGVHMASHKHTVQAIREQDAICVHAGRTNKRRSALQLFTHSHFTVRKHTQACTHTHKHTHSVMEWQQSEGHTHAALDYSLLSCF